MRQSKGQAGPQALAAKRREDSLSFLRTQFWRVPQHRQWSRKLSLSADVKPMSKRKRRRRNLLCSISKKANFLSGIEQIDALKRDRVWTAGKQNPTFVEYLNDSRHVPKVDRRTDWTASKAGGERRLGRPGFSRAEASKAGRPE